MFSRDKMSDSGGSSSGVVPKAQKAKRKISLPWFRQGSVQQTHPGLTRQHTIDTPSSFHARLLRRQPSQNALTGVLEMTWVVSDFTATNSQEMTVTKGQQVEVVEVCSSKPDFCLVRMPTRGNDHDQTSVPEGLVPLAVLKQPPAPRSSPSRRPLLDHDGDVTNSDGTGTISTSSPVNKRRGFSGRKWLPPPLRKLSQGKVEKTQMPPDRPPLKKTGSDKRIKVPTEMGNKPSVSEGEDDDERATSLRTVKSLATELTNGGGEDVDDEVELPPPMKPIQEPILVTSGPPSVPGVPPIEENPCKRVSSLTLKSIEGATSADLAEIEQIVKERMEQHSENQERNTLMRDTKSSDALTEYDDITNTHRELSAQCSSNEATALTFSGDESDKPSEDGADNSKMIEKYLRNRTYVLQELVNTEKSYVDDLEMIVEGYMRMMRDEECEIPMPEDLKNGRDKMVFGNIEAIYEWHKNCFLNALIRCIEHPAELGTLFRRYERKLHMYVVYCKNKPVSEYIVSEYIETYFEELRNKLGQKLQICDLLIKPVQRIMKYQLLLRDILKYTERAGLEDEINSLRGALEIMTVVPKAANDMMDVGRLQGFDGKITAQGKLLHHGLLTCSDLQGSTIIGKNMKLQVFLFEQSIIFSETVGKKSQFTSPQYIYKAHLQVNKMRLDPRSDCFILESTDPIKPQPVGVICHDTSPESLDKWVTTINNILQTQKDFLKAIQSPIAYQKELTKEAFILSDIPTVQETSPQRKTINLPIASSLPNTPDVKQRRKTTYTAQKAKTIGIPSEVLSNNADNKPQTPIPNNKSKLNFFGGFRNTLKSKHKSDPVAMDQNRETTPDKSDLQKRWTDSNTACDNIMAPGSQARIVCEWPEMLLGDAVTIIKYDPNQGYLVRTNTHLEEIWLPSHILSNNNRKPWSFRFRKPSFAAQGRRSIDVTNYADNITTFLTCPEFREKIRDVSVQCGSKVMFMCKVKPCGKNVHISWRKTGPDPCVLRHSGRFVLNQLPDGTATLLINNVRTSDSGTYLCSASNDIGSTQCSAVLIVSDTLQPLREPKIQVLSCSSVLLDWESESYTHFYVEYCKLGTGEWLTANTNSPINTYTYTIEQLIPGETYSFRIVASQNQLVSLPSVAVTLPVAENLRWQQEQFNRRYIELEEIGRGRFSIVRKAKDRGTGFEVALKQVFRRKQPHKITQAEYTLLAGMQHINIIHAMALFDNAPVPGLDTIVLEMVRGLQLFIYISQNDEYSESEVSMYTKQLMSALSWLHQRNLAHLDVKPENLMVDITNIVPVLKLIDFGECVNKSKSVILPPACLEFASPELVLGQPVGKHTDYWAVGVFLYVLLSGVSPFLDDSMEETTANILKCDYCFPDDYFITISEESKDLIKRLLILSPTNRLSMDTALESNWFTNANNSIIPSSRLRTFIQRRHPMTPTTPTTPTSPQFFAE